MTHGQLGRIGQVSRVGQAGRVGLVAAIFAILAIASVGAGGWAVITVDDLPDRAVSGEAFTLTFKVRQHGVTLLPGLTPSVRATGPTGLQAAATATATKNNGEYTATLALPHSGDWVVSIDSSFLGSALTLPPLTVVSPGSPFPPAPSDAARGQRLFVAKGCVTCHWHVATSTARSLGVGPDLSHKEFPVDELRAFLANPGPGGEYGRMPNLNLRSDEIAALAAFVNTH